MKKILMIGTGGTIASIPSEDGFVPVLDAKTLVSKVPGLAELAELECVQILDLDSTNISPKHWQMMAKEIQDSYNHYDGFIIMHGTDTLAYTAAALSQMLQNCNKPVVLTGAQLTMGEEGTDAKHNIYMSVRAAVEGLKGVCVAFGDSVIHGLRAKKMFTENFNGFWSVNEEPLAKISEGGIKWRNKEGAGVGEGEFSVRYALETKVAIVKLTPGLSSEILDYYLQKDYKGLILESFGAGGVPNAENNWLPALSKVLRAGVRVMCGSQCIFDGVHLDRYPIGILANRLGAESGEDLTVEAMLTKMMLELAPENK